ncbi:MAG: hypothetical protein JNM36_14965, partial [Chitinophagales bacterium]|nr:hypothetical protein [Chitinophagales bacterium]
MCKALLGINVGSLNPLSPFYGQTNSVRNLSTDPYLANHDSLALTLVGKVGIGDIDISEDADFLYFVNLYDKKLYKLDITGATPVWAASYDIPADCVAGTGDARPFGLKVKDGKVYIGSVCDAYNSQNTSDMRAYVYALDETLGTFSIVFDFPLTYPKGYPYSGFKSISTWNPWTDDFSDFIPAYSYPDLLYPQPLFTDIEIDLDGSLILGFGDRTAYQVGWQNFGTQSSDPKLYVGSGAGDILRAAYINGTYVLENNAYVAGLTGASPNNNQGPGFGEFYNDNYPLNGGVHTEIAFGALALKPGSGESIYTTMDPEYGGNSGGFRYISNTTGTTSPSVIGATLYQTVLGTTEPTFGKAAGLGDLELACSLVSFLEIGNYVWIDADADGIQDPTESGIPNVQVRLYDQSGLLVGLTTTDTNGEYYFNPTNVDNNGVNATTGAATVGYTGLAPNTQYFIVLGQSGTNTFNATNDVLNYNGNEYALTNVNTGEGSVPDQNDSDASLASGV